MRGKDPGAGDFFQDRRRPDAYCKVEELLAGDFFDGVPDGGDAYLPKGIIHDWNNEAAVEILRSCRRA
jgi:O-methyltransferase domain